MHPKVVLGKVLCHENVTPHHPTDKTTQMTQNKPLPLRSGKMLQ
jgi:hypothetical protein